MSRDSNDYFGLQPAQAPVPKATDLLNTSSNGVTRVTTDGDAGETLGVSRVAASDFMPTKTGVLSTARNEATGAPPSRINENTTVEVNGFRMAVPIAVRLGYLRRDEAGNYFDVSQDGADDQREPEQQQQLEQQQQEEEEADGPVPFPDADDEAMATAFASRIPGQVQEAVIAQVIDGGLDSLDMRTASALGMDPAEFQAGVSGLMNCFQKQADAYATKRGVEADEFYSWLRENVPEDTKQAMRQLVYTRNAGKAFGALVERYLREVPPAEEALRQAGLNPQTIKGELHITIKGQTLPARVAARLGWI
jgi:hypothetical protein